MAGCPLWVKSRHGDEPNDVRFTPESGHVQCTSQCPLSANSGHDAFTAKLVSVPLRYGDRRIAGETVYNSIPTAKIVMM
jgi:hypothetical protein